MTTTKGDILDDVMLDVGYPTSDTDYRTLVSAWFDAVLSEILGSGWDWPYRTELRTLNVTAASYSDSSLDADIEEVRKMRIQGSRNVVEPATPEDLYEMGVDLTTKGTPTRWYPTEWDTATGKAKFKLWPIPAADLVLELLVDLGAPTPLSESDVIPAPESIMSILKDGITARAYNNDSNENQSLIYEQKYANALAKLVNKVGTARAERPATMRLDGDLRAVAIHRRIAIPDQIPYNST